VKSVARKVKDEPHKNIAIHWLSGLGRGPLLVGITLEEMGLDANSAV
jgi:hypothetical protein